MLSDTELIKHFAQQVSLEDWQQQAERERHRYVRHQLEEQHNLVSFGLVMSVYASFGLLTVIGTWAVCVIVMWMLITLEVMVDKKRWMPWLFKTQYAHLLAATDPLTLNASVTTELVDTQMTTWITYHGQQQLVESITVDPDAEATVALASRIRVRNELAGKHLSDPSGVPQVQLAAPDNRQLVTDVLTAPLTDIQALPAGDQTPSHIKEQ